MDRRLTAVLPCYGRPERTRRMIDCIRRQTINNFEVHITGDGCEDFAKILADNWYREFIAEMMEKGNCITTLITDKRYGGFGYEAINRAIKNAEGKYFVFLGNDDVIRDSHFEHYLKGIEGTDFDFVYYNTYVDPHKMLRMAQPLYGSIGHSELIVRTEFIKKVKKHGPEYGHDWHFIEDMLKLSKRHAKINDESPTYFIMSVPGKTLDTID